DQFVPIADRTWLTPPQSQECILGPLKDSLFRDRSQKLLHKNPVKLHKNQALWMPFCGFLCKARSKAADRSVRSTRKNARDSCESRALVVAKRRSLDSGNVLRLPAFGAFGHVELHGLAFLQALEAACLNSGEMHENVFAILTADE